MVELPLSDDKPEPSLDVCARCHFVWFDPGELKQFPRSDTPKPRQLPQKAREQIAMLGLQQDANRARREAYDDRVPEEWWHVIPAMFGMPVEEDSPAIRCRPWLTYGLAAALVVVYTLSVGNLQAVVEEFGLVPAQLWRYGGATFFTNFFLHGDPLHLIGNVYFLLIFGDNVEDDLGWWKYVLLLAVGALAGGLCHVLGNPRSTIPCIGASSGISGVLVYYALQFPQARLGFLLGYRLYFRWIRTPAWVALLFWFLLQFWLVYEQQMGVGNVAALAHLGGAAVGLIAWLFLRISGLRESNVV